jgi:hypothetical protein
MLDNVMDLVKGQVAKMVGGMDEIPANKRTAAVEATAGSLMDGLKKYATPDMLGSLLGMGRSNASSGATAMSGLESGVISALTAKVGLSPAVAQKIAVMVIPAVMALFRKKVDDKNEPGFDLQSILGSLTGGGKSSGGGLMDVLGGMFGKK